jgi:hypothetical protein
MRWGTVGTLSIVTIARLIARGTVFPYFERTLVDLPVILWLF